MAEGGADLVCSDRCVDPYGGIKTWLGSEAGTHTVLTHVPAAFVEATGAGENCAWAPGEASTTDVAKRGAGESSIVGDVNGTGALKAEWLKHAVVIVDAQGIVAPEVT